MDCYNLNLNPIEIHVNYGGAFYNNAQVAVVFVAVKIKLCSTFCQLSELRLCHNQISILSYPYFLTFI
jgi:hypothetical protein